MKALSVWKIEHGNHRFTLLRNAGYRLEQKEEQE